MQQLSEEENGRKRRTRPPALIISEQDISLKAQTPKSNSQQCHTSPFGASLKQGRLLKSPHETRDGWATVMSPGGNTVRRLCDYGPLHLSPQFQHYSPRPASSHGARCRREYWVSDLEIAEEVDERHRNSLASSTVTGSNSSRRTSALESSRRGSDGRPKARCGRLSPIVEKASDS